MSISLDKYYRYWIAAALKIMAARDKHLYIDLVHHAIEQVSNKPEKYSELCASGDIKPYITRVITLQYYDKRSDFHKNYIQSASELVKDLPDTTPDDTEWITREELDIVISRLSPFERDLFNSYLESEKTMREFSEDIAVEIGVTASFILRNLQYSRKKILNHVLYRNRRNA
jgi:hypothetical protein